jgi:hypothetical protein
LAGEWEGTVGDLQLLVTFDANGNLTEVFAENAEGVTAVRTVTDSTSSVVGSDVTIQVQTDAGEVEYQAVLSADENTLDGTLSRALDIGDDLVITIPEGDLTLIREGTGGGGNENENDNGEPGPADTFPGSLHDGNFRGMGYFYAEAQGGFETLTGVPYDDLGCKNCHDKSRFENADPPVEWPGTDSCANCHVNLADPAEGINDDLCLGCHGRQNAERANFSDVHRDMGFACTACHGTAEMHGDGVEYNSLLESPSVACEDCHEEGGMAGAIPDNLGHGALHAALDCSACHMQSVIACYSCHFESELAGAGKRHYGLQKDYKLLVQRDGMIHPATFQTLVYEGQSFYVLAPYYAHTITDSPVCDDCHASAAVAEYNDTGMITVAQWDADAGTLIGPSGVIPVPPDWETALQFDFLDYTGDATTPIPDTDPALWQYLKTGADLNQMLFAEPLTADQIDALD